MWNGLSESEKQTWKDAAAGGRGADTESSDGEADDAQDAAPAAAADEDA